MCFNKETSFVSFLFGFSVGLRLLLSGYKFLGISLITISSMQLVEGLLWFYLKNKPMNRFLTFLVWFVILLQIVLMMVYAEEEEPQEEKTKIAMYVVLGICCFLHLLRYNWRELSSKNNKTCRLQWGYLNGHRRIDIIYRLFIVICYIYPYIITKNYDLLLMYGVALILAIGYCYWNNDRQFSQTFTSFWCFLVNLLSFYIVLCFDLKKKEPSYIDDSNVN